MAWEVPLEKEIATHSSILAWIIPWTEEPGGLQSIESQNVGHNEATEHNLINGVKWSLHCGFDLHFSSGRDLDSI